MDRQGGTFRCFVATGISPEVKAFLESWVHAARQAFPDYRFGSPQNLHVTLQFLGDVDRAKIPYLTEVLVSAVEGVKAFSLSLGEAGSFPGRGTPRVLHVSVDQGRDDLVRLADKVSRGLSAAGYRPDKPFVPHITLGRLRDSYRGDSAAEWRDSFARFLSRGGRVQSWATGEVLLMESVLGPSGPTYTRRGEAPLL